MICAFLFLEAHSTLWLSWMLWNFTVMWLSVNVLSPLVLFIVGQLMSYSPRKCSWIASLMPLSPFFAELLLCGFWGWTCLIILLTLSFIVSFLPLPFFMGNFINSYLVLYFCYNIFNFQNLSVAFCNILSIFFLFWFHYFFLISLRMLL